MFDYREMAALRLGSWIAVTIWWLLEVWSVLSPLNIRTLLVSLVVLRVGGGGGGYTVTSEKHHCSPERLGEKP